jgi:hypothetical protein
MNTPTTATAGDDTPAVRPTDGICSYWIGPELRYCRATEGVRYFAPGHRCGIHTAAALKGQPEIPAGLGWPIHSSEAQA